MKKLVIVLLISVLVVGSVFANAQAEKKSTGPIELQWWSNFSGSMGQTMEELCAKFNESQDKYHVTFTYMGSATELIAKLQAISNPADLPDLFSNGNEQTAYFSEAEFVTPLYEVMEANGGWDYSDTFAHLKKAYSNKNGQLVGYPVGNSFSIVYYNKDMAAKAGVDVEKSLRSAQDLPRLAKVFVEGGYAKKAIGFHEYGGMVNIALAIQGADSFDAGNGYEGNVTKCLYTEGKTYEAIYNMLSAYRELYVNGWAYPLGTDGNAECIPAFAKGDLAMYRGTVSHLNRILTAGMDAANVGIVPMYGCDDNTRSTGYPCAGTGNYICNTGNKEKQAGALEFIKFCALPENTAFVAVSTGYIPVSIPGTQTETYQAFLRDVCPAMQSVIDAMTNGDDKSGFPYIELSNEILVPNTVMFEKVTTDLNYNIDQAIRECAATIQEAIDLYNLSK